jgi:predicted NAD-dependent protein-ADP-ribosyltransferase YbiA (DUF1768 family)
LWTDNKSYPSVEHIYQASFFIESDKARFSIAGDLSKFDALRTNKKQFYPKCTSIEVEKKVNYWTNRKCIGIVAKMATNRRITKKLGLTFRSESTTEDNVELMEQILRLKYSQKYFMERLLSTENSTLVEFGRFKQVNQFWTAFVEKDGTLVGKNKMGNLLEKLRSESNPWYQST